MATKLTQQQLIKFQRLSRAEYLGLDESVLDRDTHYRLAPTELEDKENPLRHLLKIIRNPKNFSFTCRHIFNIEVAPFQLLMLEELWHRKYPMLVASRGASKSFMLALYSMLRALINQGSKIVIVGAAFRQAKVIFEYCEYIWHNAPILRDMIGDSGRSGPRRDVDRCACTIGDSVIIALPLGDGCLVPETLVTYDDGIKTIANEFNMDNFNKQIINRNAYLLSEGERRYSDEAYCNGIADTIKITTHKGFTLEGTYNHKIKVLRDKQIVWSTLQDLRVTDRLLIDNSERWFSSCQEVDDNTAYCLGLMIGDGNWTNQYHLGFASIDSELVGALQANNHFNNRWKLCSDNVHYKLYGKEICQAWLNYWDMARCYTKDKCLPQRILSATKPAMAACLSGLFDTDGNVNITRKDGGYGITVSLTNTSKVLVQQVQYILTHFGIISRIKVRERNTKWNTIYELSMSGMDAINFVRKIGFRLKRKQAMLLNAINHKQRFFSKDRDDSYYYDRVVSITHGKSPTYDLHIPDSHTYTANGFVTHNTKIRGQRANVIIADEFSSIPKSIYEEVVSGFAATRGNPVESMKRAARVRVMKKTGRWTTEMDEQEKKLNQGNQAIIAGTANYSFNHFADYWKEYKGIIESKGDTQKLLEVFKGKIPPKFNWRNYSVFRLPVELLPEDFMDEEHVARAQVTTDSGTYAIEYGAVFAGDSNGFYRKSLIESCVVRPDNLSMMLPGVSMFSAMLRGYRGMKYVFAVDTASESDNFAITVLELHPNHRRLVYCWTTTRAKHLERVRHGTVKEKNFYAYAARKIRELMAAFYCVHISMDSQGGGRAVLEALHDMDKLKEGELPIWEVKSPDLNRPNEDDDKPGLHIVEMVQFVNAAWVSEANHGLKKDMEDKILLYPYFDPISLEEANQDDKKAGRIIINKDGQEIQLQDTFEDAVMEIEALKDELVTIVHTQTAKTNRDHWDTPEIKQAGGKKGRLRKDRYSALLMANMAARQMMRSIPIPEYKATGGFARDVADSTTKTTKDMPLYEAPEWFTAVAQQPYQMYGVAVQRGSRDAGVFHNR